MENYLGNDLGRQMRDGETAAYYVLAKALMKRGQKGDKECALE